MTRYSWRCGYRRDREPFTWPLPCGDHEASRWWWLTAEEWRARMAAAVLGRADAGNGHLLEHVRGGDGAVGVAGSAGLELGRTERLAERAGGFPDGHVDVGRAAGGAAVELGGDRAGCCFMYAASSAHTCRNRSASSGARLNWLMRT